MHGRQQKCIRNLKMEELKLIDFFGNLNIESAKFKYITVKEVVRIRLNIFWIGQSISGVFL